MTPERFLATAQATIPWLSWSLHPHPGYPQRFTVKPQDHEDLAWLFITEQGGLRTPTTWVRTVEDMTLYLKLAYAPWEGLIQMAPKYAWEPIEDGGEAQGASVTFLELGMFRFCVRLPGREPRWIDTPDEVRGMLQEA